MKTNNSDSSEKDEWWYSWWSAVVKWGAKNGNIRDTTKWERERKNALNIYAWFLLHEYVKEWQWRENES